MKQSKCWKWLPKEKNTRKHFIARALQSIETQEESIKAKKRQVCPNTCWNVSYTTSSTCAGSWSSCYACPTVFIGSGAIIEWSTWSVASSTPATTFSNYRSPFWQKYDLIRVSIQFPYSFTKSVVILTAHSHCPAAQKRQNACEKFRSSR